jgi:hypothetical protein
MKKLIAVFVLLCNLFTSTEMLSQSPVVEYKFSGTIGTSAIELTFVEPANWYNYIQGYYVYTKYKSKIEFKGDEGVFDGKVILTEYTEGKETGYFVFFDLDYTKAKIEGKWYTMDGSKVFDVTLNKR